MCTIESMDLCEKYNVVITEEVCVCMCVCVYVCMYVLCRMALLFVTGKQVGRALDLCEKKMYFSHRPKEIVFNHTSSVIS